MIREEPTSAVRDLVERFRAGRSLETLEREANLKRGAITNYLRAEWPGDQPRMPSAERMARIATALGCEVGYVLDAFLADMGYTLPQARGMSANARTVAALIDEMPPPDQLAMLDMIRAYAKRLRAPVAPTRHRVPGHTERIGNTA